MNDGFTYGGARIVIDTPTKALAVKGAQMRQAQRDYFATRSRDALVKSKRLEAEFDKAVDEVFNRQPGLGL